MEVSSLPWAGDGLVPRSRRLTGLLSDERLVEQIRRGNEAAFETVYDRHHRGLLAFCRHMLSSQEEAEDAVQQTFISAHRDLTTSEKPIRLKPWLYTMPLAPTGTARAADRGGGGSDRRPVGCGTRAGRPAAAPRRRARATRGPARRDRALGGGRPLARRDRGDRGVRDREGEGARVPGPLVADREPQGERDPMQ